MSSVTTTPSLPDVQDILHHVFSYLDPAHQSESYNEVHECRRSLALSARACRRFTDPALMVLWKRLPDDQPLADLCAIGIAARELNPEDVWALNSDARDKPGRYRLPSQGGVGYRLPHLEEAYERRWKQSRGYDIRYYLQNDSDPHRHPGWSRFVEYASCVRAITLFAFDGPAWCGLWEELRSALSGAPILPMLSSIAFCHISRRELCSGALALISPSVRNLNFNLDGGTYPWPDEKQCRVFAQCFLSAPEIKNLRLALLPTRLGSSLRQHCSRINHLEVMLPLHPDDLRLLVELPALQYLSISLARTADFPILKLSFESITTLVVGGIWSNIAMLLDNVRLLSMHTLSVTGWHYGNPTAKLATDAAKCFRAIASGHVSISSLSVSATSGYIPPPSGCVQRPVPVVKDTFEGHLLDVVRPLLSLSGLRDVTLVIPTYFDLTCTSSDLLTIAESWRALEAFHLRVSSFVFLNHPGSTRDGSQRQERPRSGPLDAIAHFARNCPRLRTLHLSAMEVTEDLEALATGAEHPHGEPEPHGLTTLVIPQVLLPAGRTDLVGKVSEFVGRVFPLVASAFRPERFVVQEDRAVVTGPPGWCLECMRSPKVVF